MKLGQDDAKQEEGRYGNHKETNRRRIGVIEKVQALHDVNGRNKEIDQEAESVELLVKFFGLALEEGREQQKVKR